MLFEPWTRARITNTQLQETDQRWRDTCYFTLLFSDLIFTAIQQREFKQCHRLGTLTRTDLVLRRGLRHIRNSASEVKLKNCYRFKQSVIAIQKCKWRFQCLSPIFERPNSVKSEKCERLNASLKWLKINRTIHRGPLAFRTTAAYSSGLAWA